MAKSKYDLVTWRSASVPRWLISALHAADTLKAKKWNNEKTEATMQKASDAQADLEIKLIPITASWIAPYDVVARLDDSFDDGSTLIQKLSNALWIAEETVRKVITKQQAIWEKGKKPSDPSQALLAVYSLDNASKTPHTGGSSTVVIPPVPTDNKPTIPPVDEVEESDFDWKKSILISVIGSAALWLLFARKPKEKKENKKKSSRRA